MGQAAPEFECPDGSRQAGHLFAGSGSLMFAERRKHPRLPTLLVGTARTDSTALEVVCTNVSPGGGFFSCKAPPAPGSQISVAFRPGGVDGPEIIGQLEVIWQSLRGSGMPPGFGAVWRSLSSVDGPAAVRLFAEESLKLYGTEPQMLESGAGLLAMGRGLAPRSGVHVPESAVPVGLAQVGPEWSLEDDFSSDFNPPTVPALPGAEERQSARTPAEPVADAAIWSMDVDQLALPQVGLDEDLPDLPVEDEPSAPDYDDGAGQAGVAEYDIDIESAQGAEAVDDGWTHAQTDPGWDARAGALDSPSTVTWPGVDLNAEDRHGLSPADLLDWPGAAPAKDSAPAVAPGPATAPQRQPSSQTAIAAPASPRHRPSTGIRGRDLLQDSDTWIPHGDDVVDADLMLLGAQAAAPAQSERAQLTADDPGLARLRESLAAKIGTSDQQAAASLGAAWVQAQGSPQREPSGMASAAGAPSRLSALLPAASSRTTAPSDAQTAAEARAAEHAQSDAPAGDRTEVVDPRHMSQLLAQFGAVPPGAAAALSAAVARGSDGGRRAAAGAVRTSRDSAAGARPAAEVLLPRGTALRPIVASESADSRSVAAPSPAAGRPSTTSQQAAPFEATRTQSTPAGLPATSPHVTGDPRRTSAATARASSNVSLGTTGSHARPTASQTEAVGRWAGPPAPAAAAAALDPPSRPTVRTSAPPVAQMPAPEAVPLLPFAQMAMLSSAPLAPAAETIAASLPDAFSSQLHAAAPVRSSPAASLVAAGVEAAVSGSQRGESTVAYTGRQAQQLRAGAPLQEHTQNLGSRAGQSTLGRALSSGLSEDWPPDVPRSVGSRYDSLQRLGRGGHGVVYKARDRNLDRAVVLKFLQSNQLNTDVARRYFLREVKLAAGLSHPNILHIYDVAEAEGVLYYAMEFVDGVPLSAYLPGGQALTDLAFLFSVIQQLADALDHAHAAGVLHRDVKPENVLVGRDGIVKLFDFGLARMSQEGAPGELAKEGSMLIGTPYYMAPEQLMGQAVDGRADQYALGVSLFKMLTGELPFKDGNVYASHVLDPVPDPLRWSPHLPHEVRAVVEQAMAKSPAARFPTCKALALALWQALFGQG